MFAFLGFSFFEGVLASIVAAGILAFLGYSYRYYLNNNKVVDPWRKRSVDEIRSSARLLIVDDNDYPYYQMLIDKGFNVDKIDEINSIESEGYEEKYDLIILDIKDVVDDTGSEDGIDALMLLRRFNPWVPVILFTAFTGQLKTKARKDFVAEYSEGVLQKGISYRDFSEKIINCIGKAWSRDFFISILQKLNLPDAKGIFEKLEENPSSFEPNSYVPNSFDAIESSKVIKVLNVAKSFVMGRRCQNS